MSTQRRESKNYSNHRAVVTQCIEAGLVLRWTERQSLNARAASDQIDEEDNGDGCENVEYDEEDEEPLLV